MVRTTLSISFQVLGSCGDIIDMPARALPNEPLERCVLSIHVGETFTGERYRGIFSDAARVSKRRQPASRVPNGTSSCLPRCLARAQHKDFDMNSARLARPAAGMVACNILADSVRRCVGTQLDM